MEYLSSSSHSSPTIRRKEEFVYIPYSYQGEQSLCSLCFGDDAPVMLRSEKAQHRAQLKSSKLKRFTGIVYGYSALFLLLAIHSFMSWRDHYYRDGPISDDTEVPSANTDADLGVQSSPWNNPQSPLFAINPPQHHVSSISRRAVQVTQEDVPDNQESPVSVEEPALKENIKMSHSRRSNSIPVDAYDANGNPGYVADPTALKRARQQYVDPITLLSSSKTQKEQDAFWSSLKSFGGKAREGTRTAHLPITPLSVCTPGPGRGLEDEGGYKLFSEKILVADEDDGFHNGKVLCAVYSHASMYDLARAAALTWGYRCDGFLVFGDAQTIPELGFVQLQHKGEESYSNMWQKVRSIWAYLHLHYLDEYDFFHLGGDDMYVIPENLRHRLSSKAREMPNAPIFMGQQVPGGKHPYVTGGPGYSLNRKGLERLVQEALPGCHAEKTASYEDRLITECLNRIGIEPTDSRDSVTGEQTYHAVTPHTLYATRSDDGSKSFHAKASNYWSKQPHPRDPSRQVGPKHGLESAARYSVSFHNLFHPIFMVRVHTLLHPNLCPLFEILLAPTSGSTQELTSATSSG
ncbi:hypothetical protein ACA910_021551 [Epithemia clementina (nom. ined.)]